MMNDLMNRIDGLDDHTKEGIALALKGVELAARITVTVVHIKIFIDAWKTGEPQKSRIRNMFLIAVISGLLNGAGKLFKDLKLTSRGSQIPPWAKAFQQSLDIKRSTDR